VEPHTHLAHFISMQPEENLHTLGPEDDTRGIGLRRYDHPRELLLRAPRHVVQQLIETRAARWKGTPTRDYSFHVTLQGQLG